MIDEKVLLPDEEDEEEEYVEYTGEFDDEDDEAPVDTDEVNEGALFDMPQDKP